MKIFYYVAFLKRYRQQFQPDFLNAAPRIRREIDAKFAEIDQDAWTEKWNALDVPTRQRIIEFHSDWVKVKGAKK